MGYTADELARAPVTSYTHPDDVPEAASSFSRLLEGAIESYRLDMRVIAADGGAIWIDCYVAMTNQAAGAPWAALVMVQDISARKFAELGLRTENARLSRVVETQAEIAATELDLEAVSQLIAERALELANAMGAAVNILNGDEIVAQAVVGTAAGLARLSVPLLHGGRNVGSLSVAKDAVTDDDRRLLELLAMILSSAVSVAAEREARREQVEALGRFETIFESAPIGIGIVTLDGHLRNTNSVMRDISGRSAEELASRNVIEYTFPEDVDEVVRLFTAMLKGEHDSYRHEHRLYAKSGEVVWVDSATALLRDADGKPQGAVSMAQNITQRRAAEEQMRQSQKIDAIGQLTAGIAHDFNNLLLGMLGYTELAQAEIDADGLAAEYLHRVEIERASRSRADRSAARVRPAAGSPAAATSPERARFRDRRDAAPRPRRANRARDRARPHTRSGPGRSRPDAAGAAQPRAERARRNAGRRHAHDPDDATPRSAPTIPPAASSSPDRTSSCPSKTKVAG